MSKSPPFFSHSWVLVFYAMYSIGLFFCYVLGLVWGDFSHARGMETHIHASTYALTHALSHAHTARSAFAHHIVHVFCRACVIANRHQVMIDRGRIDEPTSCNLCANTMSMELVHNRCLFTDKQMIRLQVRSGDRSSPFPLSTTDDMSGVLAMFIEFLHCRTALVFRLTRCSSSVASRANTVEYHFRYSGSTLATFSTLVYCTQTLRFDGGAL